MPSSCVACGAEVAQSARFCQVCGAPQWRACHACGNEERVSAAFCSACGAALRDDVPRAALAGEHEERRVVSILFADLAGSTALGERIDPEDVHTVQNEPATRRAQQPRGNARRSSSSRSVA